MEHVEKSIDIDKKYLLPEKLSYKQIDGKHLIISTNTANWILLHNNGQMQLFNMLKNKTLGEVFDSLISNQLEEADLIYVLTELEAKDFENRAGSPQKQVGMCIYLTNECNLRCKHCYMYAGDKLQDELDTWEITKLLSDFKNFGGNHITFTGGEIALRKDLHEILKHSKDIGLTNTLLTNGILWDNDSIENNYSYIDEIQVSVDGYDENSNCKIRGKGYWHKALETVDRFCKRNTRVSVVVTPLFENIKLDKDKYIGFAQSLVKRYNTPNFNVRFSYELLEGRDVKLTELDNEEYSKHIGDIEYQCNPDHKSQKFVLNHENNVILNNCGYGEITVAADGSIFFCNRIPEIQSYGNVRNLSFDKILELSNIVKTMSNVSNLQPCSNCDIKYICGGGCRIAYFPELVKEKKLCGVHYFRPRECSPENRESFYRLMIETNELFYRLP